MHGIFICTYIIWFVYFFMLIVTTVAFNMIESALCVDPLVYLRAVQFTLFVFNSEYQMRVELQ